MANKRIKDLTDTITAFRTGDVIPVDGPSGTAKMSKDDLLAETAQNAIGSIHSLSDTATEADLVAGNYFVLDGSATKKLPAEDVAKRSVQDGLVNEIDGRTKSVSTADDAINVSINISAGEIFELSVNSTHSGTDFDIYAFYGAGSSDYDALQDVVENTGAVKFVAAKNYRLIRFYNAGRGYSAEGVVHVFGLIENVEEKNSEFEQQIGDIDYKVNGFTNSVSTATDAINVPVTIKQGDTFELLVSASHSGTYFGIYAFYGTGPSDYDQLTGVTENVVSKRVAAKNYRLIRFYNAGRGYTAEGKVSVLGISQEFEILSKEVNGETYSNSSISDAVDVSAPIKSGDTFELLVSSSHSGNMFAIYAFYGTGPSDYDQLTGVLENKPAKYVASKDYLKIRFYEPGRGYSAKCDVTIFGLSQKVNKAMMPVNILVIGDSFTRGNHWVSDCLSKLPEGSSVTSLAVIGATIKDGSNDRTTYPYTSRPVSTNNNTNKNTFACQVEKLKRLMAGVDLDAGEVQLYPDGSYPDIIIVEGGQNDSPDVNMDNYAVQFVELKENVYYKETSASAVVQGNCWSKSDIETIDRTCFAGAYRYVCETLKKLFPSSILMITTISNLNYWTKDIVTRADKIASQQKWCAAACGAPVIDWQKCQISTLTTYPGGSGTSGDPYILSGNGQNYSDSNDGMHPNTRGDKKLGYYMANEIKKNFYK